MTEFRKVGDSKEILDRIGRTIDERDHADPWGLGWKCHACKDTGLICTERTSPVPGYPPFKGKALFSGPCDHCEKGRSQAHGEEIQIAEHKVKRARDRARARAKQDQILAEAERLEQENPADDDLPF